MSTPATVYRLLNGRLHVSAVSRLGQVDLGSFKVGGRRLALVVDADEITDDPICSYIFRSTLGPDRGCLTLTTPDHLPTIVTDTTEAAERTAGWLATGSGIVEFVVVKPVPLFIASFVLVAAGLRPPEAIEEVESHVPGIEFDLDAEVSVSVFETQLHAFRAWNAARRVVREGEAQ